MEEKEIQELEERIVDRLAKRLDKSLLIALALLGVFSGFIWVWGNFS